MGTIVWPQGHLTPLGEELAASIAAVYPDDRRIWFGSNALPYPPIGNGYPEPTENDIIYQHEPLANQPPHWGDYYRRRLATVAEVWDYSVCNQGFYQARVWRYRPPLFNETLRFDFPPEWDPDIDIGFYGQLSERRRTILGFRGDSPPDDVNCLPFAFGAKRDAWAARCKVIVVPHQTEGNPVEKFRISYLLANGICVVAEEAPDQADYPGPLYVRAADILPCAREIVQNGEWEMRGDDGCREFVYFSRKMGREGHGPVNS